MFPQLKYNASIMLKDKNANHRPPTCLCSPAAGSLADLWPSSLASPGINHASNHSPNLSVSLPITPTHLFLSWLLPILLFHNFISLLVRVSSVACPRLLLEIPPFSLYYPISPLCLSAKALWCFTILSLCL